VAVAAYASARDRAPNPSALQGMPVTATVDFEAGGLCVFEAGGLCD